MPLQSGTLRHPSGPGTFSPRQAMILTFGYTSKGSPSLSKRCTAITRREMPTCGPAIPTPSCSGEVTVATIFRARVAKSSLLNSLSVSSEHGRLSTSRSSGALTVSTLITSPCPLMIPLSSLLRLPCEQAHIVEYAANSAAFRKKYFILPINSFTLLSLNSFTRR